MAYLTPDAPATDLHFCRRVKVPATPGFLELVSGALSDLIQWHNWEQFGTMNVEDTVQAFREMFLDYAGSTGFCMIGTISPYITDQPPAHCLPCDGSTHLRVDYPDLYAKLDAAFIADADSFITPDLRGRTVIGAGVDGELSPHLVGEAGGQESHTLTESETPAHTHTTQPHNHVDAGHVHTYTNSAGITLAVPTPGEAVALAPNLFPGTTNPGSANIQPATVTVDSAGGGQPHNNMMPFLALKYCVVAK